MRPIDAGAPEVSVIVPFRDVRPWLDRSLDALLDQTLPAERYESLFVDNGSTDGGAGRVAARPEVRLLEEPRPGAYVARNRGVSEARGAIFAFTDPDCEVDREWLERIVAAMEDPEVGIVLGRRVSPGAGRLLDLVLAYESEKAAWVIRNGGSEMVYGHTNNMAVRREVMERVGPFPEIDRGGDTVLVRRAVDAFGISSLRYRPDVRVRHLEVATVRDYWAKRRVYGRSSERIRRLVDFRPLGARERWAVFRRTVREQGLSPLRAALLLAALIPGLIEFERGRRSAR